MSPSSPVDGDTLLSQPLLLDESMATDRVDQDAVTVASPNSAEESRFAVLLALIGECLIWGTVVQSEASQALQGRAQFNKPFFITCFNHTLIAVMIPLLALYHNSCRRDTAAGGAWLGLAATVRHYSVLPMDRLVKIAVFVSVASLVADYFWYAALTGVSVTAANAIGNCSPLFVYCFSICFLREQLALRKIGGVLLAFVGVTFIVLYQDATKELLGLGGPVHEDSDHDRDHSVVAGMLVVVSSVFYAAYQVALKYFVGDELTDTATVVLLTALSGVFTVPLWIVGTVLVAHNPFAALREPFGWPTTSEGMALLVLSGTLAIVVNVSMPLLLCWTTPLETSVGAMLVVPLAGVWDVVFHHTSFSAECILGSVLVLAGFGVLEYKPEPRDGSTGCGDDTSTADGASSDSDHTAASSLLLPAKGDWRMQAKLQHQAGHTPPR